MATVSASHDTISFVVHSEAMDGANVVDTVAIEALAAVQIIAENVTVATSNHDEILDGLTAEHCISRLHLADRLERAEYVEDANLLVSCSRHAVPLISRSQQVDGAAMDLLLHDWRHGTHVVHSDAAVLLTHRHNHIVGTMITVESDLADSARVAAQRPHGLA